MSLSLTTVMLGVEDLARSTIFYSEGLGCSIEQDFPAFVSLKTGEGTSSIALYERAAAAADAGVAPEGSGFPGVSLHCIVDSAAAVDALMDRAVAAGGTIVRAAAKAQWGGYFGYFSDPDGHLWKVAAP